MSLLLKPVLLSEAEDVPELLSSSSLFSMLLPLILAYIGPVAASVPKVRCGKNICEIGFTFILLLYLVKGPQGESKVFFLFIDEAH